MTTTGLKRMKSNIYGKIQIIASSSVAWEIETRKKKKKTP